jgi:hypothetical protein
MCCANRSAMTARASSGNLLLLPSVLLLPPLLLILLAAGLVVRSVSCCVVLLGAVPQLPCSSSKHAAYATSRMSAYQHIRWHAVAA